MDILASLTPVGVSPLVAGLVVVASFFTAALTAAFGLGGGLALLALMSALFPPAAVGVAQLGANLSRLGLQRKDVVYPIIAWFGLGGLIGSALGARVFIELPEEALRAAVGFFVLFTVWGPKTKAFAPGAGTFFATGLIGSFLTMFFGATGPIAATMLSTTKLDRLKIVATHAGCMVVQHALKTIAFGFLGFAFAEWAVLMLAILAAGLVGSWGGTRLLRAMPEARFHAGFKAVLTMVGVYLLIAALRTALE